MATLLICDLFPPRVGGSIRYFWELYRRLPRDDFLIAAGEAPNHEVFDRSHNLRVRRVPLGLADLGVLSAVGLHGYWRSFRALSGIIQSEKISRVHCAGCLPEGFLAMLLHLMHGLPYLCFAHGEELNLSYLGNNEGMMSSRQLRWMTGQVLRSASAIIANSHNTKRILVDSWGIAPDLVRVLHPGVDTRRFHPAPRDPDVRNELGWGARPIVLTVSRLQKRKGHDRMILAMHRVRRIIPDALYAIVGDGPEKLALEDLVQREGLADHVRFYGELDDASIIRCYQQCDLFILPNRQVGRDIEGFGIVLLEAQACGRPVVAGASGGTSETMRVPETGRVVSCDDPDALGGVVAELLADRDRLHRMGQVARAWIEEKFDWDLIASRFNNFF